MNWFYLLKTDELREAIKKRDDFLRRYGMSNIRNNYYNLPKELRFIGPLQPLGELRGEKWLDGDYWLTTMGLKDIVNIDIILFLNFEFRKNELVEDYDDVKSEFMDEEWEYYRGYINSLPDVDMEIYILGKTKIFKDGVLEVKDDKHRFALMDFAEIYNQPNNQYKNLTASLFVDNRMQLDEIIDDEYFIKQITDSEIGQEYIKIKLHKHRPHFVVIPKNVKLNKNIMNILRRLKL